MEPRRKTQKPFGFTSRLKGRLEADYEFGIVTFCSSETTLKKLKVSHANVGEKSWMSTHPSLWFEEQRQLEV